MSVTKQRRARSVRAFNVAQQFIEKVKKREPINKQQLAVSSGYSLKSAQSMKPYRTDTFKEAVEPVLAIMQRVQRKAVMNLDSRDLSAERIDSVINLEKQMTHDSQLLSGKATENVANNIVAYGSDDWLAIQAAKQRVKEQ